MSRLKKLIDSHISSDGESFFRQTLQHVYYNGCAQVLASDQPPAQPHAIIIIIVIIIVYAR